VSCRLSDQFSSLIFSLLARLGFLGIFFFVIGFVCIWLLFFGILFLFSPPIPCVAKYGSFLRVGSRCFDLSFADLFVFWTLFLFVRFFSAFLVLEVL